LEQGADDITELHTQSNATAIASYLGPPLMKHNKLVEALVSAGATPSFGGVENKYEAQMLFLGHASVAAHGLNKALGISPEELPALLSKGEQAIMDEVERHGLAEDKANLAYILHSVACQEPLPIDIQTQISTGKYHGGSLAKEDFDAGHRGWTFENFVSHPHCRKAHLRRTHVLSLRAYTSSSYPRFNAPLRNGIKPHPFMMTVYYLNEAIKQLRAVAAEDDPDYYEEVSERSVSTTPMRHWSNCPHLA
jgi:hypothetical protein